ncbi:NUDIX hydrolase [Nitratireductor aestuarii]|uniref:NUDIX hydrolase n=1 Tax=Nitratireductor aestuarii TaxID=1735103 RepID=A0A916VZJ6_9HYPH|nr:NUDIX hydrolase [Nitratireductor aestuarii]GGA54539.1 NUDIX hydrolase [Nitratireductor aestuarii]
MPERQIVYRLLEHFRRWIGGNPPRTQVAALPWRKTEDGQIEVLLITSRRRGRWILPKGWVKKEESPSSAAEREAFEEAGVRGHAASSELGRYQYQKKRSKSTPHRFEVTVIPLEVLEEVKKWPERKVRKKRWLPAPEAARLVEERELARLIESFGNPKESAS